MIKFDVDKSFTKAVLSEVKQRSEKSVDVHGSASEASTKTLAVQQNRKGRQADERFSRHCQAPFLASSLALFPTFIFSGVLCLLELHSTTDTNGVKKPLCCV